MSDKPESAAGISSPRLAGWPTFSEYGGGGVLLSPTTLPETVVACCTTADLLRQVREQFRAGGEVIIHHGAIVAAQSANAHPHGRAPARTVQGVVGDSD